MGEGKATAGLSHQGLGGEPATPPLPPPPPAPGHHSLDTSGRLAGSPASITQQDIGWLLGQPRVTKPQQHSWLAKGRSWAVKGKAGQGWVVREVGVAKLPPPLVARPPQL